MINTPFDPYDVLIETTHNLEALAGQVAQMARTLETVTHHLQSLEQRYVDIQYMCVNLNQRLIELEPKDD
jgi:HEPN domain-containing protein